MVRIGKIARPHGVRGAVAVTLDDPSSVSLLGVAYVHLCPAGGSPKRYETTRTAKGRAGQILLGLKGVETVEAAETLRNLEVRLEEAQLPALKPDEFWHRDLLGLKALLDDGTVVGEVKEVVDTADVSVLVVRDEAGETFVPFTKEHVRKVDLPAGSLIVDPPEVLEP